jgi:hypothetical protein
MRSARDAINIPFDRGASPRRCRYRLQIYPTINTKHEYRPLILTPAQLQHLVALLRGRSLRKHNKQTDVPSTPPGLEGNWPHPGMNREELAFLGWRSSRKGRSA